MAMAAFLFSNVFAQDKKEAAKEDEGYKFTNLKEIPITSVKDQHRAGTCWCYSGLGFIEAELLRMGKGEYDFQGGSFYDVLYGMKKFGLVPESEMRPGAAYGDTLSDHSELSLLTDAMVKAIATGDQKSLQKNDKNEVLWQKAVAAVHEIYLGKNPEKFTYNGKEYTPKSLDEMMEIFDYAVDHGYTVAWGSDVSEPGFRMGVKKGFCVLPETKPAAMQGSDMAHWTGMSAKAIQDEAAKHPTPQRWVTQEERQVAFDNWETTDDHGMLIYGKAKDQMGNEYYMVKNSWGDYGDYHGMFYASKAFVRYKTMNIVVHKDAIPKDIKKKLGIK